MLWVLHTGSFYAIFKKMGMQVLTNAVSKYILEIQELTRMVNFIRTILLGDEKHGRCFSKNESRKTNKSD